MFSQLSACPQGVCLSHGIAGRQTPLEGRPRPLEGSRPPEGRPPPSEGRPNSSEDRPPPPQEGRPPPSEGRPLPPIRSTDGRYASYWNAYLLICIYGERTVHICVAYLNLVIANSEGKHFDRNFFF